MEPIQFDNQDRILPSPQNWDEQQHGICRGLPVMFAHGCIYSCWKLSIIERLKVLVGMPITLVVASKSMPPVRFEIGEPNDQ